MAVKIKDKMTADGLKFEQMLRELAEMEVRIGFQHGKATEEDGTDICDVAAWNELGTEHMPSRPFLRKSVDENMDEIKSYVKSIKYDIVNGVPADQILKRLGQFQQDLVQVKITEGSYEPNAPSTYRAKKKKGRDPVKPLIDTGRMRQSVDYVIQKKGSGD